MLTFLGVVGCLLIFIIGLSLGISIGLSRDNEDSLDSYEFEDPWEDPWV